MNTPAGATLIFSDVTPEQMLRWRTEALLARMFALSTIESAASRVAACNAPGPGRWYDTRAMLSSHEHAPQVLDVNMICLQHAEAVGLVRRHPQQMHLVCVTAAGQEL